MSLVLGLYTKHIAKPFRLINKKKTLRYLHFWLLVLWLLPDKRYPEKYSYVLTR